MTALPRRSPEAARSRLQARGWGLAMIMVTLLAVGLTLAIRDLTRVGLLLLGMLVIGWLSARWRPQVRVSRATTPTHPQEGEPIRVALRMHGVDTARLRGVARELVPSADPSPTTLLEGNAPATLDYSLNLPRGAHHLGPTRADLYDLFGLFTRTCTLGGSQELLVLPRTVALTESSTTGAADRRSLSDEVEPPTQVRSYRPGDDLRRVHWLTTARAGELMVRQDEPQGAPWPKVVLDISTGQSAHSFELAVSIAASVLLAAQAELICVDGGRDRMSEPVRGLAAQEVLARIEQGALPSGDLPLRVDQFTADQITLVLTSEASVDRTWFTGSNAPWLTLVAGSATPARLPANWRARTVTTLADLPRRWEGA